MRFRVKMLRYGGLDPRVMARNSWALEMLYNLFSRVEISHYCRQVIERHYITLLLQKTCQFVSNKLTLCHYYTVLQ